VNTARAREFSRRALGRLGIAQHASLDAELTRSRQRGRRLRRRLDESRARVAELEQELAETKASVRDPDPVVTLPAAVGAVVDRVLAERLTYLGRADLAALAKMVRATELVGRPGLVIEAGTALGGSAIVMASAKAAERPMKVYDVFGMIPPPSERDGADVHARYDTIVRGESKGLAGEVYYGYRENLYDEVMASFARLGVPVDTNNVELVQGLFHETLDIHEAVALAHLDGDWYESTMVCLERIAPCLVTGGRIVLDDYDMWSGCRRAVDDYFAGRSGYRLERRARLHVVKL
jgi:asparagine synthase (glutamine-hydrolysing)